MRKVELADLEKEFEVGDSSSAERREKRRFDDDDEPSGRSGGRGKGGRGRRPAPASAPLPPPEAREGKNPAVEVLPEKRREMKPKTTPRTATAGTTPATPFFAALAAARGITSRNPREEQPEEFRLLQAAMDRLDDRGKTSLVFRLVNEVLDGGLAVQPLFAVARAARMVAVAHNTAAIRKAIAEGQLTLSDLREAGIAEVKLSEKTGRPYLVYRVGAAAISAAIDCLQAGGKGEAAKVLTEHLRRAEKEKFLAAEAHKLRSASVVGDKEADAQASSPAAGDDTVVAEASATPPPAPAEGGKKKGRK